MVCASVGSDRLALLAAVLLLAALLPVSAQVGARQEKTVAEIRIALPQGGASQVAVEPDDRKVRLELPQGSVFPLDFASSSGGLLRAGRVDRLPNDRVQLELDLAIGLLDRVTFDPEAVVLRFVSRFDVNRPSGGAENEYLLGPGDRIVMTVHNRPELGSTLTIAEDGSITAPLVGSVIAAGQSARGLSNSLAELLGRSYLVDPQVDIAIDEYRSQWVMVTGEVRIPGRIPLRGGTRLKEVLAEAGGFTELSGEEIVISRRVGATDEYDTQRIRRTEFETGEVDPTLHHGDIVEVIESSYCYIQGEVRNSTRVPIERGLTLLQAITMAGGLTEWADRKAVRIRYPDGSERVVNLKKIQEKGGEDPELTGGEVVVVKRRFF